MLWCSLALHGFPSICCSLCQVEEERQNASAVLVPPSPLAAAVWLACKLLHELNAQLLPRCYPLLWQQRQPQQLSPSAALAGVLTILSRAATCCSPYNPEAGFFQQHGLQQGIQGSAADAAAAAARHQQHKLCWMEQALFVVSWSAANRRQQLLLLPIPCDEVCCW